VARLCVCRPRAEHAAIKANPVHRAVMQLGRSQTNSATWLRSVATCWQADTVALFPLYGRTSTATSGIPFRCAARDHPTLMHAFSAPSISASTLTPAISPQALMGARCARRDRGNERQCDHTFRQLHRAPVKIRMSRHRWARRVDHRFSTIPRRGLSPSAIVSKSSRPGVVLFRTLTNLHPPPLRSISTRARCATVRIALGAGRRAAWPRS